MEICHTFAQCRVIWRQNYASFDVKQSSVRVFQYHEQNKVKVVHAAWGGKTAVISIFVSKIF